MSVRNWEVAAVAKQVSARKDVANLVTSIRTPNEARGFSLFTTTSYPYLELTRVLVDSLLEFSAHNIHILAIGGSTGILHHRIAETVIPGTDWPLEQVFYLKFAATLASPFSTTLQLDSDMVASPDVDALFELERPDFPFPLGAIHPQDPRNQTGLMKLLGVEMQTQPYVHGTYLSGYAARPFIGRCWELSQWILDRRRLGFGYAPPNFDETILNVMLWKEGAEAARLPFFDPYFEGFVESRADDGSPWQRYERLVCHGCKCHLCSSRILRELVEAKESSAWGPDFGFEMEPCHHVQLPRPATSLWKSTRRMARGGLRRVRTWDGLASRTSIWTH